jgi:hypothetical protein
MFFSNIHYVPVIVAAVIGVGVGFVWYAPWAFGKRFIASIPNAETREKKAMAPIFTMTAIMTLITAFVLAALFNSLVVTSIWGILLTALLVWLGFSVPLKLYDYLFGADKLAYFWIAIGYELVTIIVMSLIIGIFG